MSDSRLIMDRWRVKGRHNPSLVLECGLYTAANGVEVRAGYTDDAPLYSFVEPNVNVAVTVAEELRLAFAATNMFIER